MKGCTADYLVVPDQLTLCSANFDSGVTDKDHALLANMANNFVLIRFSLRRVRDQ